MQLWTASVFLVLLATGLASRDLADDAEKFLLPWNLRPEHYDLTLFTHIDNFVEGNEDSFVFHGIVDITLTVLYGDVSEAVIHTYDDITIVSASVKSVDSIEPQVYNVTTGSYDPETNKQIFQVTPPLKNNGRYQLEIYYGGRNTDSLRGFYRSSFQDANNNTRWLLTTHFESFGARQAFPCFDEPEYKASFKLTINYNETLALQGYRPFFNTEIESELVNNGVHVTTFKTTPRVMSTYLVAFILAPFEISPQPTYFNSSYNGESGQKPVWTIGQPKYFSPRSDLLSQTVAPLALNAMTAFTKVGFGFDKLTQAGIPDFGPGAMENWGLVTYRETALFFNNETDNLARKQSIVSTTTHELAHQWFGDLVTLHWWTDVWLNEGFATFFATHAADTYRVPDLDTTDWDLIGKFITSTVQGSAFRADAQANARPLTSEAYDRETIDNFFDSFSYDKGGSVLRMWMHALGADIFYNGLNRYLTLQGQSVGTPEILLASFDGAFENTLDKPVLPDLVATLYKGWHTQAGFPLITATRQGSVVTLSQERYLTSSGNSTSKWNVPVSYSTSVEANFDITTPATYLLETEESTTLQLQRPNPAWVVLNNQATGYFRINYDENNWNALLDVLNNPNTANQIHPYNRAQILNDASQLGINPFKNYLNIDVALRLLSSLRHEQELVVWRAGLSFMNQLLHTLSGHRETELLLKNYFIWILEPRFNDLTLHVSETDSSNDRILRMEVGAFACKLGLTQCRQQAQNLFNNKNIHPDVRSIVMCEGVRNGDSSVWMSVLDEALAGDFSHRSDLMAALACTENRNNINSVLAMASDNEILSDSDAQTILLSLANLSAIKAREASHVVGDRRWKMNDRSVKGLMYRLVENLKSYAGRTAIDDRSLRTLDFNRQWVAKKQPEIIEWLKKNQS